MLKDVDAFSTTISNAIDAQRLTQKKVADALGVRPQTVSKWVNGENVPPMRRWDALESLLQLPAGTFYNLAKKEPAEASASSQRPDAPGHLIARLDAVESALRDLRAALVPSGADEGERPVRRGE